MEFKPQLVFIPVESGYWRRLFYYCWAYNAGRLPNSSFYLHAVHALLRPIWVDPVCGRSLCIGLDPIARARTTGQDLLREHDDLPVLGPLVRNLAIADVGAANHRSDAVQRIVSAGICRFQPDDRDERG